MPNFEKKKLGDLLKEAGLVTELQIVEALSLKKQDQKLGDLLVDQGYITEKKKKKKKKTTLSITPYSSIFSSP